MDNITFQTVSFLIHLIPTIPQNLEPHHFPSYLPSEVPPTPLYYEDTNRAPLPTTYNTKDYNSKPIKAYKHQHFPYQVGVK